MSASKREPTDGEIRLRAYHIWQWLGCPDGYEDEIWVRAETELNAELASTNARAAPLGNGEADAARPSTNPRAHAGTR